MTDDRLPWFRCFPSKWLGALAALPPSVGYVYLIVCFRMYELNGPCPDTLDALVRRTGYNKRIVSDALNHLFKLDKLRRTPDGIINPFAEAVIEESVAYREGRKRAGEHGANARWKKPEQNQQNGHSSAIVELMANDSHLHLPLESLLPLESEVPLEAVQPSRRRRSARAMIREDWEPTEKGMLYARGCGFGDAKTGQMVRACRDYHLKHGTLIAGEVGLAATWRTWCDNEVKFSKRGSNGGFDGPRGSRSFQDDSKSVGAAATRLQEQIRNGETVSFPPRPRLGAAESEDDYRLLSKG